MNRRNFFVELEGRNHYKVGVACAVVGRRMNDA